MKLFLKHRHHSPSGSLAALVRGHFECLARTCQIDEAWVLLERRPDASPAFRVAAHLMIHESDVSAEAVDHTLRAALVKVIAELETRLDRCGRNETSRPEETASHGGDLPRA